MCVLAGFSLKLKDSALFNNLAVWLSRTKLRVDIHLPSLYSSHGCFCQTVELLNMRGKQGNSSSLKEAQFIICVPLEQTFTLL